MTTVYQCDVIACAMFLTGQASNVLIAKFAKDVAGVELTLRALARRRRSCPGSRALLLVPLLLFKLFPPDVRTHAGRGGIRRRRARSTRPDVARRAHHARRVRAHRRLCG